MQNVSLLSEARCSMKCKHQQQCMMFAFTVSTLRKCAARVFGDAILERKGPSIPKQSATPI
eukprot:3340116-Pleurochrysis_carterae.AAC.1